MGAHLAGDGHIADARFPQPNFQAFDGAFQHLALQGRVIFGVAVGEGEAKKLKLSLPCGGVAAGFGPQRWISFLGACKGGIYAFFSR